MSHHHHQAHGHHGHAHHEHHHSHHHAHSHADPHTHSNGSVQVLKWPVIVTLCYAFVELFSGWLTGSLALMSDATHMFSDAAALLFAWFGAYIASQAATDKHTFGLKRAEVLVAFVNALAMLAVVAMILHEAFTRFRHPEEVSAVSVMIVAVFGLFVNIFVAKQLHEDSHNLNSRAALMHVMGDILGSVAAILAGIVIYFTHWLLIDPILSILIAALILRSTWALLKEVIHVLMEGVPLSISIQAIQQALLSIPSIQDVTKLHVWTLTSGHYVVMGHVVVDSLADWNHVSQQASAMLKTQFSVTQTTLQPTLVEVESK